VTQDNSSESRRISSFPDLLRKEVLAALLSLTALCFLAILIDAPTGGPADPSGLPAEHVKAPWIFIGIQQILRHLPVVVAGVMLPLAAVLIIALLPFVAADRTKLNSGIFFGLVIIMLVLTIWGYFG
jgi:quinol-cytochrome oxidoreductase complex cytochrome b subunit